MLVSNIDCNHGVCWYVGPGMECRAPNQEFVDLNPVEIGLSRNPYIPTRCENNSKESKKKISSFLEVEGLALFVNVGGS